MTFRIDKSPVSTDDAHRLLKIMRSTSTRSNISHATVLNVRPDFTLRQADDFLRRMAEAGLLAYQAHSGLFKRTDDGISMDLSGLMPRIDRPSVDHAIEKAITAARIWNEKIDVPVDIVALSLFGSALEDRPDYGDVDIALTCRLRSEDEADMKSWIEKLPQSLRCGTARYVGKTALSLYWKAKACRYIEKTHTHISAMTDDVFERTGCDWMQIYAFDPDSRSEVSAERIHHPRSRDREAPEAGDPLPDITLKIDHDLAAPPDLDACCYDLTTKILGNFARHGDREIRPDERALIHAESFPAWIQHPDQRPKDPAEDYAMIQSVLQEAKRRNHLLENVYVSFTLSRKSIDLTLICFEGENTMYGVRLSLECGGKTCDLKLYPERSEDLETHIETDGRFISLARSLAIPMRNIHSHLRLPSKIEGKISFDWDPRSKTAPKLPSFSRLGKLMKNVRPTVTQDHLAAILDHAKLVSELGKISVCATSVVFIEMVGTDAYMTSDPDQEPEKILLEGQASRVDLSHSIDAWTDRTVGMDVEDPDIHLPDCPKEMCRPSADLKAAAEQVLTQMADMGIAATIEVRYQSNGWVKLSSEDTVSEASLRNALQRKGLEITPT